MRISLWEMCLFELSRYLLLTSDSLPALMKSSPPLPSLSLIRRLSKSFFLSDTSWSNSKFCIITSKNSQLGNTSNRFFGEFEQVHFVSMLQSQSPPRFRQSFFFNFQLSNASILMTMDNCNSAFHPACGCGASQLKHPSQSKASWLVIKAMHFLWTHCSCC